MTRIYPWYVPSVQDHQCPDSKLSTTSRFSDCYGAESMVNYHYTDLRDRN